MATHFRWIRSAFLAVPAIFATQTLVPHEAFAQNFEKPRSFAANQIPGIAAGGQNYTIKSPVTSDGFMRIYVFTTPWGEFSAIGDGMAGTAGPTGSSVTGASSSTPAASGSLLTPGRWSLVAVSAL